MLQHTHTHTHIHTHTHTHTHSGSSGGEFLHSSPGDYVWGPQGIDNMISQMLASLEDPGPPPAEQSKIDALPTVLSTQENMKNSK